MKDFHKVSFIIALLATTVTAQQFPEQDASHLHFKKLIDSSETFYDLGEYKKSMEVNIKILNRAFEIDDPRLIHKGYRFLGYDFLALKDTVQAKENFIKSEQYAIESKNDTAIAITYMDLANLYATQKSGFERAFSYHKKSIKSFRKIKDSVHLAKAHYNTVITAFEAKKYKKGLYHLIKADQFKSKVGQPSFDAGLENLFGEYYAHKKNYDRAENAFLKAINIGEAHELIAELEESYKGYSDVLYEMGAYQKAYDMRANYEKYLAINNEILASAIGNSVSSKYQVSEYQKRAEAAQQKNALQAELMESKNRTNTILWVILAIIITGVIYFWYAYRKRKSLVEKLRTKNREYLRAKQESDKLAKAKAKFFSTVSHELRTPLYGVIGLTTILMENKELKKHEKDLKSLKFSADYLLALINDVLQMNKIDSNDISDESVMFDLEELINTIVSSFEYMRLQHNNSINVHIEENTPSLLKGSSVRLSQVLMNLIGNACKFTENGSIDVFAEPLKYNDECVLIRFTVKDTGMGIAKNRLDSIFNEFAQIETTNSNYQGTGLGLPIVKKLLKQANSEIEVTSELEKGSIFSFNLLFDVIEEQAAPLTAQIFDTEILQNKSILIVEDNRINQTVTKKILEKEGVRCQIAENGALAIEKIKAETFDLVLMDINMPVKNGIDATRDIRKFNQTLPIIALTAVEIDEIRYKIFNCGMNDIIVKPYDVTKFRQTIVKNITLSGAGNQKGTVKRAM